MSWQYRLAIGASVWAGLLAGASTGYSEIDPVGPEVTVNQTLLGDQNACDVSSDGQGKSVFVWQTPNQDLFPGLGVYGRIMPGLGNEFPLHSYPVGDQSEPTVSQASSGNFVAAWISDTPTAGQTRIVARRYFSTGTPNGGEIFVRTTNALKESPAISIAPSGDFFVAWKERTANPNWGTWGRAYRADGVPISPAFQLKLASGNPAAPAVSHNSLGEVVVTWANFEPSVSSWIAEYIAFDASGTVLFTSFANEERYGAIRDVDVSHGQGGDFAIAWSGTGGGTTLDDVRVRRFDINGIHQGQPVDVNSTVAGNQTGVSIAHGENGDFVIGWHDNGANWGQCFDSSGSAVDPQFGFNFATGPPAIAYTEADEFVAAWSWIPLAVDDDVQTRTYRRTNATDVTVADGRARLAVTTRPTIFRTRSTIGVQLAEPTNLSVRIVDLSGRVVRTLLEGTVAGGDHAIEWDGRSQRGESVAAGVYFYRVQAGGETRSGRLVRLR